VVFPKGIAQTIEIVCYNGGVPTNPTNPVATISKDGGAFAGATNTPTVVGSGLVTLDLTPTEADCDYGAVKIASDNLEDQVQVFYTEADYTPARAGYLDKLNVGGTLAEEIADGVWDERLTGATHNIPTSAGRRLRQVNMDPFFTTYYVNKATGDDSNDGDAPDVPFASIAKALSSAVSGDHVVVAPGTYSESNLDLDTSGVIVICEPGTIIDGTGASACFTISASSCEIKGAVFHPSSPSVGLDVRAGAHYVIVDGCCACQCSVGFSIDGNAGWIKNSRSIEHTETGFDVLGPYNRIDRCKAVGAGAAVRGFYLSNSGADFNQLLNCTSIGNTTAGFEIVNGADQNTFAFCSSGGSDGEAVDNGDSNAWSGYAIDPALRQADIFGSGSYTVTRIFKDEEGNTVANLKVTCKDSDESAIIATRSTDSSGSVTFNLDSGTYHLVTPSTVNYEGSNTEITVSGNSTNIITLVRTSGPSAPDDPSLCRVYAFLKEIAGGQSLGVGDGSLDVVNVLSRPSDTNVVFGDGVAARETDANGYVYVDIVRGAKVRVKATWTGKPQGGRTVYRDIAVPDADTYDVGQDLQD